MRPVQQQILLPFQRYTPPGEASANRGLPGRCGCTLGSDSSLAQRLLARFVIASRCHSGPKAGLGTRKLTPQSKTYKLRGKVVSTNPSTSEVTLDHEAIPGFMDAMTMPYKLKDANILSELHPGDVITADLLVSQGDDADVVLDHIVVVGQGKPDYKPKVSYHVPAPGDAVPDFKLRNQDGRAIHLNQFRGKELLITFIYTRCPLPNFCPLVTHNFAEYRQAAFRRSRALCQDASALRKL